jgi:4-alpha-glucanotransferase
MSSYDELIKELSELCGIMPEYWDIFGKKQITSVEAKRAILTAMKLRVNSIDEIIKEINERKYKSWRSFIEPVYVTSVNEQPLKIPVYIPVPEGKENKLSLSWRIEDENNPPSPPFSKGGMGARLPSVGQGFSGEGDKFILSGDDITISEQQWINGMHYIKVNISDTIRRDIGYYKINIECTHPENIFPEGRNILQKKSKLIITPDTCYIPPGLQVGRTWGLSINLYSIRSSRNWGIGDFTDLNRIVRWIADLKGGFVGINPLHTITNTKPFGISPYSPISRLYKNFIYLDIENILDVSESEEAQTIIKSVSFKKESDKLKKRKLIDYEQIALLKEKILRHAFLLFYERHYTQDTPRGRDFQKYVSEEGNVLESYSLFFALWEHMNKTKNTYAWQDWPKEYHDLSSIKVQTFKNANKKGILFYKYIQWLIDRQLKEVAEEARNLGMVAGLYHDLAIGSVNGGSDVWSYQHVIAGGADVGAPPDDFNLNGQNWGFPPLIPEKLKDSGYELFIQTIRKNMKYGGALRIDHALGLFRLFWIPRGMSPKEGTYVRYPSEDLLRIIALESVRNRTILIAEDLGTIGEEVRETLRRFQMLSYRLFYFERNYPDPSFLPPDKYPAMALCAVTTHDLPTLYGYWVKQDIKIRKKLDMYPDKKLWQQQMKERERDRALIISALNSQGIIPDDYPSEPKMTPELCQVIYQYLARTPCKLLLVSLDDIIGTLNQQNMPGTVDSYPNWVQKIPSTLEGIVSDERFVTFSEMIRKNLS